MPKGMRFVWSAAHWVMLETWWASLYFVDWGLVVQHALEWQGKISVVEGRERRVSWGIEWGGHASMMQGLG